MYTKTTKIAVTGFEEQCRGHLAQELQRLYDAVYASDNAPDVAILAQVIQSSKKGSIFSNVITIEWNWYDQEVSIEISMQCKTENFDSLV